MLLLIKKFLPIKKLLENNMEKYFHLRVKSYPRFVPRLDEYCLLIFDVSVHSKHSSPQVHIGL